MTREQWATQFLKGVGAEASKRNLRAVISWIQAEGGTATWNPLNTTKDAAGASDYNWVGVKNYPSAAVGLTATVSTLLYGANKNLYGYKEILTSLKESKPARNTLAAVEASMWGTGGLALQVLPYVKKDYNRYAKERISE